MLRDLAPDPLLYLFRARRSFRLEQYIGPRVFLCAEGVLDADDARVVDGRVGEEDGFELGGSDLVARDFDEFLWKRSVPICGSHNGRIITFNRSTM